MSRDQSECTLLLIPATDFELPRELRGDTPPTEEVQLSTNLNMGTWNESTPDEAIEKYANCTEPRENLNISDHHVEKSLEQSSFTRLVTTIGLM